MFAFPHRPRTPRYRWLPERPAVVLAAAGAAVLIAASAVAPVGGMGQSVIVGDGGLDSQELALASVRGAAETIAERDTLGAQLSPADQIAAMTASGDQEAWARLVLHFGGWEITQEKVDAITQWMRAENYPESWWLRNNPLNNGWYTDTGNFMGSYANLVDAAYYAADSIKNRGIYPSIRVALEDPGAGTTAVASAIINSGWATGFYGGGSHWHTGAVPQVVAPASAWGR